MVIAFVLALTLREIPLSDTAGLAARREGIGGEAAKRLEAERITAHRAIASDLNGGPAQG